MTDYGTIKIPEAAYERHNERRKELGLTWEEYINGEAPEVRSEAGVDKNELYAVRDEIINTLLIDDYATEEHIGELAELIRDAD